MSVRTRGPGADRILPDDAGLQPKTGFSAPTGLVHEYYRAAA
jgi:hypothetical protein